MLHKLKSQRGETLVEVLASILIAALSVALLFTCVMASVHIGREAKQADETYYAALRKAEEQKEKVTLTNDAGDPITKVRVAGTDTTHINIDFFGGEGMYAYAHAG